MTTSDDVMQRAVMLAGMGGDREEAVAELLATVESRRVAVVLARQHLLEQSEGDPDRTAGAVDLLDEVLLRLPVE